MYQMFPLLTVSLIIYAVITFTGVGDITTVDGVVNWYDVKVLPLDLPSGDVWEITWGVIFLVLSMGFLFVELIRATQTGADSITNHLLSFLLFIIAAFLFVLMPGFGNGVFFVFLTMLFLDPMAGFIVTTVTARRDFGVAADVA